MTERKIMKTISEMNQDVKRLNTITDRFSKIGSQPTLSLENINLLKIDVTL